MKVLALSRLVLITCLAVPSATLAESRSHADTARTESEY